MSEMFSCSQKFTSCNCQDYQNCQKWSKLSKNVQSYKDIVNIVKIVKSCQKLSILHDDDYDEIMMMMIFRGASGDYICSAVNGVGHPAHATLTLTVLCE